ncbi:MAG: DUF4919 domain-containing protein [Planctomycetes bacterium]|nr:DUF4919 domain-containing protein [Planctomycetota bacterium]
MPEPFFEFLREPNRESFLAARRAVLEDPSYQPYSTELEELDALIEQEDYQGVLDRMPELVPNLVLSPRLHLMLAYTQRRLGNTDSADMEGAIARTCADGILMTGDGTAEKPWLVLRTSDEYDVLMFIDKKMETQALIRRDGKALDRLACEDGSEVWFDVSDAMNALNKQLRQSP